MLDPHRADHLLAQKCLDGDEAAISAFRERYWSQLIKFLTGAGGTETEAEDIVNSLWADALAGPAGKPPLLKRYGGDSSLGTWLKTVALNRLLSLKRRQKVRKETPLTATPDEVLINVETGPPEMNLLQLMRTAVEIAFSRCSDEHFVLLHLKLRDGLQHDELARMWQCSPAKIARTLGCACVEIAETTRNFLREVDPWLELKWEDFLEMCRYARPSTFGESPPE